jgi:hypothetical protein
VARGRARRRRARLVASVAVGAVVVFAGAAALATVITDSDQSQTQSEMTASPSSALTPTPTPATPTAAVPSPTATALARSPATASPRPQPSAAEATPPPVRPTAPVLVLNNSTIPGLAARSADRVRSVGFTVPRVGNVYGQIDRTTVYYRPGNRAQADLLAGSLRGLQAVTPAPDWLPGNTALTLVVTRDFAE